MDHVIWSWHFSQSSFSFLPFFYLRRPIFHLLSLRQSRSLCTLRTRIWLIVIVMRCICSRLFAFNEVRENLLIIIDAVRSSRHRCDVAIAATSCEHSGGDGNDYPRTKILVMKLTSVFHFFGLLDTHSSIWQEICGWNARALHTTHRQTRCHKI